MSRFAIFTAALCLTLSIGLIGCTQSAYVTKTPIEKSKEYATVEEQVKYLVNEGYNYIRLEKYDRAINVAKYILQDLDSNSVEAKEIIGMANAEIEEAAKYKTSGY